MVMMAFRSIKIPRRVKQSEKAFLLRLTFEGRSE